MKCIKKIIVLLMAFVMVTGCQTNPESSKPGTIKEINIDKMVEKFANIGISTFDTSNLACYLL